MPSSAITNSPRRAHAIIDLTAHMFSCTGAQLSALMTRSHTDSPPAKCLNNQMRKTRFGDESILDAHEFL